jgi:hypothetical protein
MRKRVPSAVRLVRLVIIESFQMKIDAHVRNGTLSDGKYGYAEEPELQKDEGYVLANRILKYLLGIDQDLSTLLAEEHGVGPGGPERHSANVAGTIAFRGKVEALAEIMDDLKTI